jgi:hypothetical protein
MRHCEAEASSALRTVRLNYESTVSAAASSSSSSSSSTSTSSTADVSRGGALELHCYQL